MNPISAKLKLSRLDQLQSIFDTLCSRLLTDQASVLRNNETIDSQIDSTYQDIILIIGGLHYITQDYIRLQKREKKLKQEIRKLESTIKRASRILKTEVQKLIKQLNKPMNEYYQYIQDNTEQNIKLQIDSDKETGQEHLKLAIEFIPNHEDLQPSGYLSNSQMHSFALAFRLASIKVLNPRVPILILDDIVNSYDAEYRNRIVSLISEKFHKFQIILFTHDEQFYQMLMDKMGSKNWSYNRIIRFHPNYGPVFRDYESIEEEMLRLWEDGHSALHLVRLIQENNAKKMVKDLGIKVSLLASNTTRNHSRAELFRAIRAYLEEQGLFVPKVGGIQRNAFQYFVDGLLENAAVHIQDETFGSISIGDQRHRWEEYKKFIDLFICKKCGYNRFMTQNDKMVCRKKGCGTEFTFEK